MSLAHQSIATISSPQFINLQPVDINPLMSSCEIKVLYVGANRNGSYISKQVAEEMAKTLRGAPIVGYYKEDKQDFRDHGEQVTIDGDGIHFNCLTKPYGFIAPNARVWFQDFEDTDEGGKTVTRKYLMTTGFLWTGQFKEAQLALKDGGRPQSMELDEKSLEGYWTKNIKDDIEFFIINDAIFSKLCILGDDVEPCFEGSAVTAPQVSTSFTLDDDFKHTLFTMMKELRYAIEGGKAVENQEKLIEETAPIDNIVQSEEVETTFEAEKQTQVEAIEENTDAVEQVAEVETTFEEKKEDQQEKDSEEDQEQDQKEAEDDKKKYALLEQQYSALKEQFDTVQKELFELKKFKTEIDNKQKDELISQFYMLSDEDKKDVIQNKEKYTFDEIESKLAVICFKKKVNFDLEKSSKNENITEDNTSDVVTFNIKDKIDSTPDWIKAVEQNMNRF